jgi:hypothetical protein
MRCVRVSGLGQWEGAMSLASLLTMTIALFAALHFWIGLRALWPPPMGGLNAIGTAKRESCRRCDFFGKALPNRSREIPDS